jgi:hypothetical protein
MDPTNEDPRVVQKCDEMRALVRKYDSNFSVHHGSLESHGEVVLLTGSTGTLGSYMLESLLRLEGIEKVYAFNRAGPSPLYVRQEASFLERCLDAGLLRSPKLVLLEGDASQESLGIEPEILAEMKRTVTCIIHNGMWYFPTYLRWVFTFLSLACKFHEATRLDGTATPGDAKSH